MTNPGDRTNSLVLYKPIPAGFTWFAVISPPNDPITPPTAIFLAVPFGVNQESLMASSIDWDFADKTKNARPLINKPKYFFILVLLIAGNINFYHLCLNLHLIRYC